MTDLQRIEQAIKEIQSVDSVRSLFGRLGYPVINPLPEDISQLPDGARQPVVSVYRLADLSGGSPVRIFLVELNHPTIRGTDIRRFLEAFYRRYPLDKTGGRRRLQGSVKSKWELPSLTQ